MRQYITIAALSMILAGCAGNQPTGETTPAAPKTQPSADRDAAFGVITFKDAAGQVKMTLTREGALLAQDGTVKARFSASGKELFMKMDGKPGARLRADGQIVGPDDAPLAAGTMDADGGWKTGDALIKIDADGAVVGGNPKAPGVVVEGATSAMSRRAAMFVLVLHLTMGKAASTSPAPVPAQPAK